MIKIPCVSSQLQVRGRIPPAGIFPFTSHGINSAAKNVPRAQECRWLRGLERPWRSVGSFSLKVTGNAGWLLFTWANRFFTVWLNGMHNAGLVNFVAELRLSCLKISSMHRKTAANTANQSLKLNGSWKPVSKMALKKVSRISIWNFRPTKYSVGLILTFNTFRCPSGIFPGRKHHIISDPIFQKHGNGKQPQPI